ncbi:MAG: gamma-glutamyltransferase family protein, partial [Tepidiformaceae bacterium]
HLPMAEVLAPAIEYAASGFPVSPRIARLWAGVASFYSPFPGFGEVFLPGGQAPGEGQLFRNPALARTLTLLASEGRDAYYNGSIAAALVKYSDANGGFFSPEDFSAHRSTWDAPVGTDYRGHTVWEMPPNSQGIAALQLLNILELFDVRAMGRESADFWHLALEAKKLVYADRARHYCDPAFSEAPIDWLVSKAYARERAKLIDMGQAAHSDKAGEPPAINRPETTYLCTADSKGMMVSLIQSNYTDFGSGYAVPELGFGLQDRGGLFSLDPAHANALAPGKRPFQTIIPAFVTRDGEPWMAFGLMGGDMQPQGHAQIIMNLVDFDMDVQQAGDAIRFHHTGSSEPTGTVMTAGGIVHIEDGLPLDVLDELQRRGHLLERQPAARYGGYQAIRREPESGVYAGATESRKDGAAVGY